MDLYQMNREPELGYTYSSRPRGGIRADGRAGILHYHSNGFLGTDEKDTAHVDMYLADGYDAWIVCCDCEFGANKSGFEHFRPIFIHMLKHFKRNIV